MAVTTEKNKIVYDCDGSTQFYFDFPILKETDLQVWYYDENNNKTLLQLNTDYTITLNDDNTGYITLNTTYNNGKLLLYREVPYTQETVYPENSPFPAKSHERALDKLTMEVQQLKEKTERTLKSDIITNTINANGKRIINVGDPIDDKDACNYKTVLELLNSNNSNNNGDMLKSTYDKNNNGIVDKAEAIDDGSNTITAVDIKDAVDKKHNRQHAINSTDDHTSTITPNKLIKADNNGLPTEATNTDEEVANAVNLAHSPYIWGTHEIDETNLGDGKIIKYSASAGKWVIDDLPDMPGGSSSFLGLTDTPNTYSGNANKILKVKSSEDGIEFVDKVSQAEQSDNANTVGGFSVSTTPTANTLLPLDNNAKIPNSVLYTGSGNGLDADTLDGLDSLQFLRRDTSSYPTENNQFDLGSATHKWKNVYATTFQGTATNADKLDGHNSSYFADSSLSNVDDDIILNKLKNVDGSGSELDADTVDGKHANDFADNNHTHTIDDLSDTNIINASNNQILIYDNGKWVNNDMNLDIDNDNIFIGINAGANVSSGVRNIYIGTSAGSQNTNGNDNIFIGYESAKSAQNSGSDIPSNNTIIGSRAGYSLTTGIENTFIGAYAGYNHTWEQGNTFVGYKAGYKNISFQNTFIGDSAGENNSYTSSGGDETKGYANTFIGWHAGKANTTGYENTFIGHRAGRSNTTGIHNVFIGQAAGDKVNGDYNVYIGWGAAYNNSSSGYGNTCIGRVACYNIKSAYNNVTLGEASGYYLETGYNNVFIGRYAGAWIRNGSTGVTTSRNCTLIGSYSKLYNNNDENEIVIGYNAIGHGSNTATIGDDNLTATYLYGTVYVNNQPLDTGLTSTISKQGNGYEHLSDGLLIQWGTYQVSADGSANGMGTQITLPTSYPTACAVALATALGNYARFVISTKIDDANHITVYVRDLQASPYSTSKIWVQILTIGY